MAQNLLHGKLLLATSGENQKTKVKIVFDNLPHRVYVGRVMNDQLNPGETFVLSGFSCEVIRAEKFGSEPHYSYWFVDDCGNYRCGYVHAALVPKVATSNKKTT